MKPIPASTSTFGDLIEGYFAYADKTAAIRELVRPAFAQYIRARPRRFGKSLVRLMAVLAAASLAFAGGGCRRADAREGGGPRIASLAPNLTEIAFAIGAGDALVGRTDVCNYPPECESLPVVGNFGRAFPEALAATRTEAVMCVEFEDKAMIESIESLGVRHELIPCRHLDDIPTAIARVGELTGHEAEAAALSARIADEIEARRERMAAIDDGAKPVVFLEMWDSPLVTAGRDNFMSEVVALAGGRNLGDELTGKDYSSVSEEMVIACDPDVIICLYGDDEGARKRISSRVGWSGVKAVANGRIYAEFNLDAVCRPGPRIIEGIEEIESLIGREGGANR